MSGPRRKLDPKRKKAPRNEMLLYATGKPRPPPLEQVAANARRLQLVAAKRARRFAGVTIDRETMTITADDVGVLKLGGKA